MYIYFDIQNQLFIKNQLSKFKYSQINISKLQFYIESEVNYLYGQV